MLGRSNSANTNPNPNNKSSLLLFKPRQVLLSQHHHNTNKNMTKTTPKTLNPQQKTTLLHSVSKYLKNNGFSKTLKRFLSEAKIQSDDWKASSLDLEDLCCEFLNKSSHANTRSDSHKEQELETNVTTKEDANNDCAATEETSKKKKKKKGCDSDYNAVADKSEATDKEHAESKEIFVFQSKAKSKGDKKSKKKSDHKEVTEEKSKDIETDHKEEAKSKDKKKKKKKTDSLGEVLDQESVEPSEDTIKTDKKSSKKRKRLTSDENEHQPIEKEATEESKRRKVEGLKETKNENQLTKDESKQENGYGEKLGDKISAQKTPRSQQNGSAEPKKASAFQRVKIDEVEFADEKLQDNSYWAKDGAEIGYGAKAQEVLGQVRGRDFRHEKTKKKRGSYRGGQIDLHSHSIKFNYSEEE